MTASRVRLSIADRLARRRRSRQHRPEVAALEQRLLLTAAADQSAITLSVSAAYVVPGSPVTLKAIVTDTTNPKALVPNGTVAFYDNGTLLGSVALDGSATVVGSNLSISGIASLPIQAPTAGSHAFSATYSGNSTGSLLGNAYGYTPVGSLRIVAGTVSKSGSTGNNGPAAAATVGTPYAMAVDQYGDVFMSDYKNNVVQELTPGGTIHTIAGVVGGSGDTGDGGAATSAQIGGATGLAVANDGTVYIADNSHNVIRALTPNGDGTYNIKTVAGMVNQGGPTTDGHLGTQDVLSGPQGLAVDAAGNLYMALGQSGQVVELSKSNGYLHVVAGNGNGSTTTAGLASGDGGSAHSSQNGNPYGVVVDASGNVYFSDTKSDVIREVTTDGLIHTVAGVVGKATATGDGGQATAATIGTPTALALDTAGNLYIATNNLGTVRQINSKGIISTVAITPPSGSTTAQIGDQYGLAIDAAGDLLIPDYSHSVVREVGNTNIRTYVGYPYLTITGATTSLTAGGTENLTITEYHPDGTVDTTNADTIALTSTDPLFTGGTVTLKNGVAIAKVPLSTAGAQTITAVDNANYMRSTTGNITVSPAALDHYQVTHVTPLAGDRFGVPLAFTITAQDAYGNTVTTDTETLQATAQDSYTTFSTAAPTLVTGQSTLIVTSQPPANVASYSSHFKLAGAKNATASYNLGVDQTQTTLTATTPSTSSATLTVKVANITSASAVPDGGTVTFFDGATVLGTAPLSKGTATFTATGLATGAHTFMASYGGSGGFGASSYGSSPAGYIRTVAGGGTMTGDNIAATKTSLNLPDESTFDAAGNFYFVDYNNMIVRQISPDGTIRTVAGISGQSDTPVEGAVATQSPLGQPSGVAVDARGNLYIADRNNSVVYRVTTDGIIHTYAGTADNPGSDGDGGSATAAHLSNPSGLAVDAAGNLYIADFYAHVVRKVAPNGIISTVAGVYNPNVQSDENGNYPSSGDGGLATQAQIGSPLSVAVDAAGNLYIAENVEGAVRKVTPNGIISTIAGIANQINRTGDGGPATQAQIGQPYQLALDAAGDLYIEDGYNNVVRKVTPGGIISTIAGIADDDGYAGDNGPATKALLTTGTGLAVDAAGDLFVSDSSNNVIREIGAGLQTLVGSPSFRVTGLTSTIAAGGTETFTVTALKADGTQDSTNNDYVTVASTDPTVNGGVRVQLVGGSANIQVALRTAGSESLTLTDVANPGLTLTTPTFTVIPAAIAGYQIAANSSTSGNRAGVALALTARAIDAFGNTVTADNEAFTATDSDPNATLNLASGTFSSGLATLSVTPHLAGVQVLTLVGKTSGLNATNKFTVLSGLTRHLVLSGLPPTITAGTSVPVTITAQDQYGNIATDDTSAINLGTSTAHAPITTTLVGGTATVPIVLTTPGTIKLTAASADGTETGTASATVVAAALAKLVVTGPTTTPTGQSVTYTVTALDAFGNTTSSTDALAVAITGGGATPPTGLVLKNGTATFSVTYTKPGAVTLAVSDTTTTAVTAQATTTATTTIQGAVFLDLAGTGVQTASDPTLANRVVYLDLNGDGMLDSNDPTATTDSSGHYAFTGVTVAAPTVREDTTQDANDRYVATHTQTSSNGSINLGLTLLSPEATLPVTAGLLPAAATTDPTTAYIGALYRSVLGRAGSAAEIASFVANAKTNNLSRSAIATIFINSPEHRQLEVTEYYQRFLGRTPDAGAATWVTALENGTTESQVIRAILGSAEYQQAHPTTTSLISSLYNDILARATDPAGAASLAASGMTNASLVATFVDSAEAHDDIVESFYEAFLHRQSDASATATWVPLLNSGTDTITQVAVGILSSSEFLQDALAGRS